MKALAPGPSDNPHSAFPYRMLCSAYVFCLALLVITGCTSPVRAPFVVAEAEAALEAAREPLASLERAIKVRADVEETAGHGDTGIQGSASRCTRALRWRLALIDFAISIDTQYFYNGDNTGLIVTNHYSPRQIAVCG